MILVYRALQQRLRPAGRPVHRIAGYPIIDPAGRITLKQCVRDRRQYEGSTAKSIVKQLLPQSLGKIGNSNSTDEKCGKLGRGQLIQPRAYNGRDMNAERVFRNSPVEHERPGSAVV